MNRFEKWSLWSTAIVTALTGFGFFWTKYLVDSGDPFSVINHPLQPWLLKAHIITAPLLVFAVGLITLRHIWPHFRAKIPWGRRSGIITAFATAPMVVTGYVIQAVTHEGWLFAMAVSHISLGALFSLGLAVHLVCVRRRLHSGDGSALEPRPGALRAPETPREPVVAGSGSFDSGAAASRP